MLLEWSDQHWTFAPSVMSYIGGLFVTLIVPLIALAVGGGMIQELQRPGPWDFGRVVGAIFGAIFCVVFSTVFPWWGLHMLTHRVRFDKQAGEVSFYWRFKKQKAFQLSDILAVQTVYAGRFSAGRGGSFQAWQLNLIVRKFEDRRINISTGGAKDWVIETGRRLAEFLDVPFAQQIGGAALHEKGKLPPGVAAPDWLAGRHNTRLRMRGSGRLHVRPIVVNEDRRKGSLGRTLTRLWRGPACAEVVFDKNRGTRDRVIVIRLPGRLLGTIVKRIQRQRPLEEVTGVLLDQCLETPTSRTEPEPIPACQLALELRDADVPLLVLAPYAETTWARHTAQRIAKFLDVPFTDRAG
jgi:hypothetical protein